MFELYFRLAWYLCVAGSFMRLEKYFDDVEYRRNTCVKKKKKKIEKIKKFPGEALYYMVQMMTPSLFDVSHWQGPCKWFGGLPFYHSLPCSLALRLRQKLPFVIINIK